MMPDTILPLHIDSTMVSCFRSCPQKFLLEFVHGYRPPGLSIDLHAGSCFATAIETVYKEIHTSGQPLEFALQKAHAVFLMQWGDFEIPDFKRTAKTKDNVWNAVESYFREYPPLTDHVQPFFNSDGTPAFEYTFAIPLDFADFPLHPSGDPWLYSGRFDMLGTYSGRPCVRDEKTSGKNPKTNTQWADQWDLRSQFIGYTWACQQSGMDLDTVIVRGIGILMKDIHHAEAIKIYPPHLVDRWFEQLRRDLWRLRRAWDEGYFDYNLADACTQYGNCVFLPVCQSKVPDSWLSNFEIRPWNPLIKNPIETPAKVGEAA